MIKTHKQALCLNNEGVEFSLRCSAYARQAWNSALADFKDGLDRGEFMIWTTLLRRFNSRKKEEFPWAMDLPQVVSKNSIRSLGISLQDFFRRKSFSSFPKFKSRWSSKSFCLVVGNYEGTLKEEKVWFPKLKQWVKTFEPLRFKGKIVKVTIKQEGKRWFACVSVRLQESDLPKPFSERKDSVGIDLGLTTFATLSDGRTFKHPKPLKTLLRKLRHLDKAISRSRKVHGSKFSNRRRKLREQRAQLYLKIRYIRNHFQHELSTFLVRNYKRIVVEDLNIQGMVRNKRLARAILEASWKSFLDKLRYKCEWYGVELEVVDRWFPSTKTCSSCGFVKPNMDLGVREYVCDNCNLVIDRDLNAAVNLNNYSSLKSSELKERGDEIRPVCSTANVTETLTEASLLSYKTSETGTLLLCF